MKTIYYIFSILLIVLVFSACQREEIAPADPVEPNEQISAGDSTILGKRIPNAYTVENMTKAYNKLHPNGRVASLQASHQYVRFLPESVEQIAELVEDTVLSLYQYPLDYQVIQEGDYYQDTDLPNEAMMSFYTVVEANHRFHYQARHQVLADLYLPESSEEALEDEAYRIKGMKPMASSKNARKYHPSGYVHVEDRSLGRNVPLRNVHIRVKRLFRIENVRTNNSGYWYSPKTYRGDVTVKVIFEHPYVDIRSTFFETFWPARERIHKGDKPNGARYVFSQNGSREWAWATAFNGVMEYYDYCRRFGITTPPGDLKMYIHRKNGDPLASGYAPMFTKGFKYYRLDWDNAWRWLGNVLYIPVASVLGNLMKETMPDIVYTYDQNNVPSAERLLRTLYHELAHASHYAKVGNGFWGRYIRYIVSHGSYGDGTENDAGLVGLSESWGFHIGPFLVNTKYGTRTNLDAVVFRSGWIPAGVHNDLMDVGEPSFTGITDNVSGYNTAQIFSCMDSNTDSPTRFRDQLRNKYSNSTETNLNNLFSGYGY